MTARIRRRARIRVIAGCALAAAAVGLTPPAPANADPLTEFRLRPGNLSLDYAVTGPDGAIWFTEFFGNRVGRITTAGKFTDFRLPTPDSNPKGITVGSDGAIWFTEESSNKIGRITTSGELREFPLPTPDAGPWYITAGPDGALWFTEFGIAGSGGNKIGRITTTGAITEFSLSPGRTTLPVGISAGRDGALWFTEDDVLDEQRDKIGRITTAGVISEFPLPRDGRNPTGIAAGPDGALWFTETDGNRIGRITTAGAITEYRLPRPRSFPFDITVGPDGALWFTEFGASSGGGNKIGRITTAGAFRECPIPTANSAPYGIAPGPDGALWFTEFEGNLIGRLSASGCLVRGKAVGIERESGKVRLGLARSGARTARATRAAKSRSEAGEGVRSRHLRRRLRFEVERRARQVPVGSFVDVRRGSVILSSGRTANGSEVNSGVFRGGLFQVLQSRKRRLAGLTTLRLQGGNFRAKCGTRARSSGARPPAHSARLRRSTVQRIRGTAHGHFRVRSRYSAATVRGTTFSVADRCDGTLTKVKHGRVVVRDFDRKKTVIVRAGKSYLAQAP